MNDKSPLLLALCLLAPNAHPGGGNGRVHVTTGYTQTHTHTHTHLATWLSVSLSTNPLLRRKLLQLLGSPWFRQASMRSPITWSS